MSRRKKSKPERPIFDAIRKPVAPPSRRFDGAASDEKHLPSLRKAKHRKKPLVEDD